MSEMRGQSQGTDFVNWGAVSYLNSLHTKTIFGEGELDADSTVKDYLTTAAAVAQAKEIVIL